MTEKSLLIFGSTGQTKVLIDNLGEVIRIADPNSSEGITFNKTELCSVLEILEDFLEQYQ